MTARATASELPPYQDMLPYGVDDELGVMHMIDGEVCIDYADGEVKVQGFKDGGFGGGSVLLGSQAVYVWLDEGRQRDASGDDDNDDKMVGGMRLMHRDIVDVQARWVVLFDRLVSMCMRRALIPWSCSWHVHDRV